MSLNRYTKILNSALWAAYGDAFGFITELADKRTLKSRLSGDAYVDHLRYWKRRIGGTHGATVDLPKGMYSDDTQLRLATSRAITADGTFDVEAFAKVELPVWQSYSLGAGRGSKLAAANLAKPNVSYFSNFYSDNGGNYFESGGNGASMRIQPHVWSRPQGADTHKLILDVFQNTICTHGHMVAIVGAAFHALCLKKALELGAVPNKEICVNLAKEVLTLDEIVKLDPQISSFWLPTWENKKEIRFNDNLKATVEELITLINSSFDFLSNYPNPTMEVLFEEFDAKNPSHRGSSLLTSVLAVSIAHFIGSSVEANNRITEISNCLGSDTDTISTKIGALVGAVLEDKPPHKILDQRYISAESYRLFDISRGEGLAEFIYPDLFKWEPPKYQNSALGTIDGQLFVEGLGFVTEIDRAQNIGRNESNIWQWVKTKFGQTLLIKRRKDLSQPRYIKGYLGYSKGFEDYLSSQPGVRIPDYRSVKDVERDRIEATQSLDLFSEVEVNSARDDNLKNTVSGSIDDLTYDAIKSGFDPRVIGEHILSLSDESELGIEKAISYVSIIAKARISRHKNK